jgi:hypothetical protein
MRNKITQTGNVIEEGSVLGLGLPNDDSGTSMRTRNGTVMNDEKI